MTQALAKRTRRTIQGTIAVWALIGVFLLLVLQTITCFTWRSIPHFNWGSQGSGEGQFKYPRNMVLNASGQLYVLDTDNSRVQVFTQGGQFLFQWGSFGSAAGQFDHPNGIAINGSGHVYVADNNNHRVQVFTQTGHFLFQWGTEGQADGQFRYPRAIAINGAGNVYVMEQFEGRVQVFTQTGQFLFKWGSLGSGNGQFGVPGSSSGITINGSSNVYIADSGNHRVQVFTQTGQFLFKWGSQGSGNGQFSYPSGITIDPIQGSIYVADTGNARVQMFMPTGEFAVKWGSRDLCELAGPSAVVVNATGGVLVLDSVFNRVQSLYPPGRTIINYFYIGLVLGLCVLATIMINLVFKTRKGAPDLLLNRHKIPLDDEVLKKRKKLVIARNSVLFGGIFLYVAMTFDSPDQTLPGGFIAMVILSCITFALITLGIVCALIVYPLNKRYIKAVKAIVKEQREIQRIEGGEQKQSQIPASPEESLLAQNKLISSQIQVLRQFEYIGGKVRMKVNVTNTSSQGFHHLRMSLENPGSFRLLRVDPSNYIREGLTVQLGNLLPNEEKAVAWVLEPLICGKEQVKGTVNGMDAKDTAFTIPINPLLVEVRCPLFVRPEEANLATIQRMLGDLPVHSTRSFLLPKTLTPDDAFELAKKAIGERDVLLVGMLAGETGQPYDHSAWFYGVTKVKQKRFVITATVSEADQAIRITSACDEEDACTGFLAEAGASVRRELVSRGAVDSEEGVVELVCEKCGATLPQAPVVGRDVTCPDCRWTWRVSDFYR